MASRFVVDGNSTTIQFDWEALTAKIQPLVDDASEIWYSRGVANVVDGENNIIIFDNLTNNQKLKVIEAYFKMSVVNAANEQAQNVAVLVAREAQEADQHVL